VILRRIVLRIGAAALLGVRACHFIKIGCRRVHDFGIVIQPVLRSGFAQERRELLNSSDLLTARLMHGSALHLWFADLAGAMGGAR
jgi:hypothetical protein